jgi:hypothetical protein
MDARLGRFLSPDPYVFEPGKTQAFNRYSYVYNNPLSYTDPSGYCGELVSGFVCASVLRTVGNFLFGGNKHHRPAKVPPPGCYVAAPGCWGTAAAGPTPGFNPLLSDHVLGGGFGGALQFGANGDLVLSENLVIQWGLDFLILDSIRSGMDTYDAVREGRWGDAVFSASGLLCDLAKGCKFLSKIPGVDKLGGWARRQITGGDAARGTEGITKTVKTRPTPGRDGATSEHIIERTNGEVSSVTHRVTKDGQVLHQHQTHVGRPTPGRPPTERRLPEEWLEYPTIPKE